ncbi:MAG: tetratricopeptide repeat protein [Gemmatimonadetes bacterium]|nr:tetratricopeptide repeat protein [Gemmatimonadota bacterium]
MNTPRMVRTVSAVVAIGALLLWAQPLLAQQSAEELYQAALYQEEVQGDLQRAIDQFGRILVQFRDNRAVGARAQLHIGLCYEKLGQQEAQQAYRRVIADFPEHAAEVAVARERLAGIERSAAERHPQPTFEKIEIPTMPRGGVLSPDGTRLAFVSERAVWTVPVRGRVAPGLAGSPVRIAALEDVWDNCGNLSWSGDGRWIAANGDSVVYVVPSEGGEPRVVPMPGRGSHAYAYRVSLSPDGGTLAFSALREGQIEGLNETEKRIIYTVPTTGGKPRAVTDIWGRMPAFSPDGRTIAFVSTHQPPEGDWSSELWTVPTEGGQPTKIAASNPGRFRGPVWSPDGDDLAVNYEPGKNNFSRELWVIRVNSGETEGPIAKIRLPETSWTMPAGWTPDGRLAVFTRTPFSYGSAYEVPASGGKAGRLTPEGGYPLYLEWSPGGERLFFVWNSAEGGDSIPNERAATIASVPAAGGPVSSVPLPWGREVNVGVGLDVSPDGNRVVFMGVRPDLGAVRPGPEDVGIWTAGLDGRDLAQLTEGPWFDAFPAWSPDGHQIAFIRLLQDNSNRANVCMVPAAGGEIRQITTDADTVRVGNIDFSPDGQSVAFFSRRAIETVPVAGGPARVIQRVEKFGSFPELSWSPDGARIAYTNAQGGDIRVATLATGRAVELSTGLSPEIRYSSAAWSPDGRRIAFIAATPERDDFWLISDFMPGRR